MKSLLCLLLFMYGTEQAKKPAEKKEFSLELQSELPELSQKEIEGNDARYIHRSSIDSYFPAMPMKEPTQPTALEQEKGRMTKICFWAKMHRDMYYSGHPKQ